MFAFSFKESKFEVSNNCVQCGWLQFGVCLNEALSLVDGIDGKTTAHGRLSGDDSWHIAVASQLCSNLGKKIRPVAKYMKVICFMLPKIPAKIRNAKVGFQNYYLSFPKVPYKAAPKA